MGLLGVVPFVPESVSLGPRLREFGLVLQLPGLPSRHELRDGGLGGLEGLAAGERRGGGRGG